MNNEQNKISVLRLGHRLVRDDRVSTHVGLVARAFGASEIFYVETEQKVKNSIDDVTKRFGGELNVKIIKNWRQIIKNWKKNGGIVIQLTMYGLNISTIISKIRKLNKDILLIIGSRKVPGEIYYLSDYNIAIGNQPHSEISALAIFLDKLFIGKELRKEFSNKKIKIIPSRYKKEVQELKNEC